MRRVAIIGTSGAGKSTLAAALGSVTGLPVIHLDALYWRPGWVETPDDEWDVRMRELIARPEWIIDGNYGRTQEMRLAAADTVIFLDIDRWRCFAGVFKRLLTSYGRVRPDMAPGCRERLDPKFLLWIWSTHGRRRRQVRERLQRLHSGSSAIILRNPAEVAAFLHSIASPREVLV